MFKALPLAWKGGLLLFHPLCLPQASPVCGDRPSSLLATLPRGAPRVVAGRVTSSPCTSHGSSLQSTDPACKAGSSFDFESSHILSAFGGKICPIFHVTSLFWRVNSPPLSPCLPPPECEMLLFLLQEFKDLAPRIDCLDLKGKSLFRHWRTLFLFWAILAFRSFGAAPAGVVVPVGALAGQSRRAP